MGPLKAGPAYMTGDLMRIRFVSLFAIAMVALFCGLGAPALRATDGIRELRSSPQMQSSAGTDYVLRTAPFGGLTVTLIDVQSGTGDWVKPDASKLPALPAASSVAPKALSVQWFYGDAAGWMPVPAGWRVQRAVIGADGNTIYTFAAPAGASAGWVTYTVIPACESCILQSAAGLLPGAGERLAAMNQQPTINLGQTNPVMSWQSRPDDCSLLFRYRSGSFTVRAAVLSSVSMAMDDTKGGLSLADVYVALPEGQAALADYLVGRFQQAFPACRSPNGWPG